MTYCNTQSGVYQIVNRVSGTVYVGSSVNLKTRKMDHWKHLRHKKHANAHLRHAWEKYGESAFSFHVIEFCDTCDLLMVEQTYLDATRAARGDDGVYNDLPIAGSPKGRVRTPEHCARIANSKRGKPLPGNASIISAEARRGKPRDPEAVKRTAEGNRGQKRSPEVIARWSEQRRGIPKSEEYKAMMSAIMKGRPFTKEHRDKINSALRARAIRRRQELT